MANQNEKKQQQDELMHAISSKLRNLIDDLGVKSPSQFADALGVSPAMLSHLLKPKCMPSATFFQALKEAYPKVEIDDFYDKGVDRVRIDAQLVPVKPTTVAPPPQPKDESSYKEKFFDMLEKYNKELEKRLLTN